MQLLSRQPSIHTLADVQSTVNGVDMHVLAPLTHWCGAIFGCVGQPA